MGLWSLQHVTNVDEADNTRTPWPGCLETAGAALTIRLVAALAVTTCAFTLGCGSGEGASEGMVWHLVRCRPNENATPEEIQKVESALRGLVSEVPAVERIEWGRIVNSSSTSCRDTHWLLLTFKNLDEATNVEYREAFDELREGLRGRCVMTVQVEFVVHDATPHARTATRGHHRRAVLFRVKKETTPTELEGLEVAMSELPSKIPAIERLQWGTATSGRPSDDPASYRLRHCLLLTFKDAGARDECLAHPSYGEFESVLEQYSDEKPFAAEYVAR